MAERETRHISIEEAEELAKKALEANEVAQENAESVSNTLIAAEIDGHKGHGLSRLPAYAAQARSKKVNGMAEPVATFSSTAMVSVDAQNGFASPAIGVAISYLTDMAFETGIAAATIHNSHHAGQLGAHVENVAIDDLVALMFSNTPKAMAPWGGKEPVFGTNPIAFAAPRKDAEPLVIDLSLSKIARGRVMAAARSGDAIPEGCALDADGNPTTDPEAALAGSMVPMGDAKGAALALMVEILAATLTGANQSYEASSFFDDKGSPPGVGQTLIAIDPAFSPGGGFANRLEQLLGTITSTDGVRLPGSRRMELRDKAYSDGLSVPSALLREIEGLANGADGSARSKAT